MNRSGGHEVYPAGAVVQLIDSAWTTEVTASALRARMLPSAMPLPSAVFDARELACLSAVAGRLIPQSERTAAIDLAGSFHRRIAEGAGIGWRHAELPPAAELHKRGLAAVDSVAMAQFGDTFSALPSEVQDKLLRLVQAGSTAAEAWKGLDQRRWFEETLALLVDLYFSHPLAQDEIGYAGMADAGGWPEVGLDAREAHEPVPHASRPPLSA